MKKLYLFFSCVWCLFNASAQVGSLDPAFGTSGIQTYPAGTVLTAPDNTYYTLENIGDNGNNQLITLVKHLSSGAIDLSYGTAGSSDPVYTTEHALLLALQKDGKIIMVTTVMEVYGAVGARYDQIIFRFDTNGALDLSFNNTGYSLHSDIGFQLPQSVTLNDDIIVVQGTTSYFGVLHYIDVYDVSGNGTGIDISDYYDVAGYDPVGSHFNYAIALDQANIYLSRDIYVQLNDEPFVHAENYIEKLGDPSYGENGRVNDNVTLMGANNGRLIIPSAVYNPATGNYGFVLRGYNPDGSPDINLNINGQQITDFAFSSSLSVTSIVFQGDKIIVGGTVGNALTGMNEFAIARYNADGTLDAGFDGDGKQTTGLLNTNLNLQRMTVYESRLYVVGDYIAALYILEDDNNNPITLSCSAGKTVDTDPGVCTALLEDIGPFITPSPDDSKVNYILSGATTGSGIGTVSGMVFNRGITTVTYSVIDNPAQTCTFNVTVEDKGLPVLTNVSATPTSLWPPNHKFKDVAVNYNLTDNCPGTVVFLSIKSNEPQTGTGAGDEPDDWQVIDPNHVKLRAERNGHGTGRIYTITIKATDAAGNITKQEVNVTVPLNQGSHKQSYISSSNIESLQVKVLSNPSKNYFTLQTSSANNSPLTIRVTNAVGSLIETRTGLAANGQVQVGSGYHDGLYIAEIIQAGKRINTRLIKLKQ